MKNFYKKILIFLIPVFVVWVSTEAFYRFTENNYTFKSKIIKADSDRIETLILGDSHSFFGINPEYFTSTTFNFANVSQTLYFDELLLQKHIDSLPNLRNVVLNISYFTLSAVDNSSEDRWRRYFYQQDMDLEVSSIPVFDPKQYSLTLARRFDKSVDLFVEYYKKGTLVSCYENGYGMQDKTNIVPDKEMISELIAKKHEDNSVDFEANVNRLQRIIELCNKKGVEVFLIEMPVYKTYYGLLNAIKKEKINSTLSQLEFKNNGVRYFNFCNEDSLIDSDFRDADHLTNEGAKKFSKLLDSIIEKESGKN